MEKAGLIGLVKLRYIESDEDLTMRGEALAKAIAIDRENGLIPFFVSLNNRFSVLLANRVLI